MRGKSRTWNDEQFRVAVAKHSNFTDVLRELGLRPAGGNHATVKRHAVRLSLDISHFNNERRVRGLRIALDGWRRPDADIFRENCLKNGVLAISLPPEHTDEFTARVQAVDGREPFTVDLEAEEIRGPGGYARAFEIAPHERTALLEGLDDIGLTLKYGEAISEWERRTSNERPFLQALSIRR